MNLFQETKFIMNQYNITANKGYGQNFLVDETIVNSIVEKANVCKEDFIIEIGPGLGTLTALLLEKAGKVVCIELDPKMVTVLNDRFSLYDNFELIHNDVLKEDLKNIIESNLKKFHLKHAKVVANLPYYITTPIIMKLLEDKLNLDSITVMVQKEVAERLAEKPGGKETGAITYSIHYYTNPEIILDVPNTSFVPAPKVDSAVIKLQVLKKPNITIKNESVFFKVVKAAFLQKRKTLLNSLSNAKIANKSFLENMLNEMHIDLKIRGEKLSLKQFGEIADYLFEHNIL